MRLRKRHAWGAVLIALFALPVLKPDGVASVEEPTGAFFSWFAELVPAPKAPGPAASNPDDARIRELEAENRRLWNEHLRAQEKLLQSAELGEALKRSELDRVPMSIDAQILRAHDPYPLRRSILIDRGQADGVQVGQPVVMGATLLGRVRVVRESTSLVQLVTDPYSRFEVFVLTSKGKLLRGYARRGGSRDGIDELDVEFVHLGEDVGVIGPKAPVFTANFDERVPAHLLIGLVTEVSDPDQDRMPKLFVRPSLDLDRSTEVRVLLTGEARRTARARQKR